MLVSVVLGVITIPLVGKYADTFNPQIVLPSAFFVRFVGIAMFTLIKDPKSIYCYATSCAMILGTMMENVIIDCLLLRRANPQIRGVLYSSAVAFGYVGLFIFSLIGGILFDKFGPYMPFVFVGGCDLVFGITSSLLGYKNVLKNDFKSI
jgi:predicted MFS family arabinose efflux permease